MFQSALRAITGLALCTSVNSVRRLFAPFKAPRRELNSTTRALFHRAGLLASLVSLVTMALGASALAGVNLANDANPPRYSQPLTLYVRDGKIFGAFAVGNKGKSDASAFQVGFYVNGTRKLVATFNNGLRSGYMGYGTDAPFDLPDGESVVEMQINDTRWLNEDTYADNNYRIRVTVNRGGGGGTTPAISRSEASYKFPSSLGYSTPSRIISRANEMFNAQFVPVMDFTNWRLSGSTGSYFKGTKYYGLPYSQSNPPTDVAGFLKYVPAMMGVLTSITSAGVDCSSFISIVWELTSRHGTSTFDAPSSLFTTVVEPGTLVKNAAKIQAGDAINSSKWTYANGQWSGHIVLVLSVQNGKVETLEATADQGRNLNGEAQRWSVVKNTRALSDLDTRNCRVIRRNRLN